MLLGLPAEERGWEKASPAERTGYLTAALLALIASGAATQLLIIMIEDQQWMDEVSAAICHRLMQAVVTMPVRIFATFRPEHAPARALARHATLAELPERSAGYSMSAAAQAMEQAASTLAQEHVAAGLADLETVAEGPAGDRPELGLRKVESVAEMALRGGSADSVERILDRAALRSDRLSDADERFVVLRGKARYLMPSGQNDQSHSLTCQCQELMDSGAVDSTEIRIETSHMFWTNGFFRGDYNTLLRATALGRKLYDPLHHGGMTARYSGHHPGACACLFSAIAHGVRFDLAGQAQDGSDGRAQAPVATATALHRIVPCVVCGRQASPWAVRDDTPAPVRTGAAISAA